jgi:hypothetical protein
MTLNMNAIPSPIHAIKSALICLLKTRKMTERTTLEKTEQLVTYTRQVIR